MAYTTAQLDVLIVKLETSLGSGAVEVEFEGRRTKYRTTSEIMQAISYFQGLKSSASDATTTRIRQTRMSSRKGL